LNSKSFISFSLTIIENLNLNGLKSLSLSESQYTIFVFIINKISSSVCGIVKLNSFIGNSYGSVRSILSNDIDLSNTFRGYSLNWLLFFKSNRSWLIIINNSNNCLGVSSFQHNGLLDWSSCWIRWFIKLNPEILIRLPVVIIIDNYSNILSLFPFFKLKKLVNKLEILSSVSFLINSSNSYRTSSPSLVCNSDF